MSNSKDALQDKIVALDTQAAKDKGAHLVARQELLGLLSEVSERLRSEQAAYELRCVARTMQRQEVEADLRQLREEEAQQRRQEDTIRIDVMELLDILLPTITADLKDSGELRALYEIMDRRRTVRALRAQPLAAE